MLYVIGDLHLSLAADKKMDIFPGWEGYVSRLRSGFSRLTDADTCVLCGDSSWGMDLDGCLEDFRFIDSLPGQKIVLKGNHDYWWNTAAKIEAFFAKNEINTIKILHNNSYQVDYKWICGTRGWMVAPPESQGHDAKIMQRELMRLEASLKTAGEGEKICFLHYPPKHTGAEFTKMIELMSDYGVKRCFYGHIHLAGSKVAFTGNYKGIEFRLISADYIGFEPQLIP